MLVTLNNNGHRQSAFTTIEILVVIAIMSIFAVLGYVNIVSYYNTTVIDSELHTIVSNIQRTRQKAIGNATDSDYSIKFLTDKYVVFIGSTYNANASTNLSYSLENSVIVSTTFANGIVTFSKFTGRVAVPGYIDITAGGLNKRITVNALGIVEDIQ